MTSSFDKLRSNIFGNETERTLFRQLLVNQAIATDIFDKELLRALQTREWVKTFG
jgi:hypothetical protein